MLSRTECAALRGLAIIGIFLHNYCHWLGFAVKENEYTFTMSKSSQLIQALAHPDLHLPIHLLSPEYNESRPRVLKGVADYDKL